MRETALIVTILLIVLFILNFQLSGTEPDVRLHNTEKRDTLLPLHLNPDHPLVPELQSLREKAELKLNDNTDRIEHLNTKYVDDCKKLVIYYENIISGMKYKNLELKTNLEQFDATRQDWYMFKKKFEFELDSFEQGLKDLVIYNR